MIHKGLVVFGSVVAVAPFVGSAGYFIIPPLMKTLPRHISQVKSGGECFTALTGKDKWEVEEKEKNPEKQIAPKENYLLVCRTGSSDLNFYYYISDESKVAIPVKAINISGERNDRDVTIKFFWRSSSTLQLQKPLESVQWIKKDGQDYELKDFCNRTEVKAFNAASYSTKTLVCHREVDDQKKQEVWGEFTKWGI